MVHTHATIRNYLINYCTQKHLLGLSVRRQLCVSRLGEGLKYICCGFQNFLLFLTEGIATVRNNCANDALCTAECAEHRHGGLW